MAGIAGGTGISIQGLWAGEWLRDVAGFNQNDTSNMLLVFNFSLLIGMICTGFVPHFFKRFKFSQIDIYLFITIILLTGHALLTFEIIPRSSVPWILIGISASSVVLAYSWLNSQFPLSLAGKTSTALNLSIFLCSFTLQYAIGWIISFWDKTPENTYPSEAYSIAFLILLILQIFCVGIFIALKPKTKHI